ncbi:hypothetical protein POM88_023661 [Heracleum sosnowskyi]|uniref:phosphoethanolamine N-methyltransferase n=1 Tax=Heracleum sosnowskyi TaxID=360622 RepID=A0AAD8II31_9APIA|nr:hypothetical protein POM88_023661 [Heracleum sosnowskyi]
MLEARTQEVASLNITEPTMHPMSINEMSRVAPKTYNFCQVCGIQGHYGYECLYNVYNSQSAQFGQMNSFEEGYGYNQCSYAFDQEWTDQSTFLFMENGVQNFPYHDQQQFEQQYHQPYEQPPMQHYHYPPLEQENLHISQTNVDVQTDQTMEEHVTDDEINDVFVEDNVGDDEVLSTLPPYGGKSVLELGAGIGRFTGELAEKPCQILALDFIDSVIKKNESINGHHKNAKFMCVDVTSPDLKIEDESMDLIFLNWLLMYLSDKEVFVLF